MDLSKIEYQSGDTQASGQTLGYSLQYTRMVTLLLESVAGSVVSLEVFEDVGVQLESKDALASQTKSSLGRNPVSDRAVPFWKTLWVWLEAIRLNQLPVEKTVFELYVFGDYTGDICTLFDNASSIEAADVAVKKAKEILLASGDPLPQHIAQVLDESRIDDLLALLVRFRYRHGSGSSIEDLRELFAKALIPAEFLENVLTHAIGWVKQKVDTLIERKEPAAIPVDSFREEITSYTQSLAFSACLADLAGPARPEDIEGHKGRRYVLQLELISVGSERILSAILT